MSDITDQLSNAITELQSVETALSSQAPTVGDQVLEAIIPVLTSAGYTVTAPSDAPTEAPVTT